MAPTHPSATPPCLVLSDATVCLAADTPPLFDNLSLTIQAPLTGIIGRNGAGKSSLLRLLAGRLTPTSGSITTQGTVDYLPQDLSAATRASTVAALLNIERPLDAIARIEAGSINPDDFDAVGNDWDIAARAHALITARVPSLATPHRHDLLRRPINTLSGGELVRLAMAGLELAGANILLLDEPTNNLDQPGRTELTEYLRSFPGHAVIVSHDVALLRCAQHIIEVQPPTPALIARGRHSATVRTYGGNYDLYLSQHATQRQASLRRAADARAQVKAQQRDVEHLRAAHAKQTTREQAATAPLKRKGKLHSLHSDPTARRAAEARRATKLAAALADAERARDASQDADAEVRRDESIRIPIIDPSTPRSRTLLRLTLNAAGQVVTVGGGDRIALTGPNGAGKTTLVRRAIKDADDNVRVGFLDQRLSLPDGTVLKVVSAAAPKRPAHDTYELLSKFLITGDIVHRRVSTLSGGERFRVALARLLLACPPSEVLVLDEPTNNLDLDSIEQLVSALSAYRGAIVIVSHDVDLLRRIGIEREVTVPPRKA